MNDLWKNYRSSHENSIKWLKNENFISCDKQNEKKQGNSNLDVEQLLDSLSIAIIDRNRKDFGDLEELVRRKNEILRELILAATLDMKLWESTESTKKFPNLKFHQNMLQKISNSRRRGQYAPWIFTTNYDLAIEWAAESNNMQIVNGFEGILNREFKPHVFDQSKDKKFSNEILLVKLHGSLTWENNSREIREISISDTMKKILKFLNGIPDFPEIVIPGSIKFIKTTQFMYAELLRQFGNFLVKRNPVLFIVGYSFGDEHINKQILSALIQRRNLRIVAYLPEVSNFGNIGYLSKDLKGLIERKDPNVTIIGGGKQAYFDAFVDHLPN